MGIAFVTGTEPFGSIDQTGNGGAPQTKTFAPIRPLAGSLGLGEPS
jgi:hypothetical protein